jgi:hypothetical protein
MIYKNMDDREEIAEELGLETEDLEDLDEDTLTLMVDHDLDKDTAQKAQELIDEEGLDEDEAVELAGFI